MPFPGRLPSNNQPPVPPSFPLPGTGATAQTGAGQPTPDAGGSSFGQRTSTAVHSPHAAHLAAGRNAETLVRDVFASQDRTPFNLEAKAVVKQATYRVLRSLTGRSPLTERSSTKLMHAQHDIESVSSNLVLGAANRGADLKRSEFRLAAYEKGSQTVKNELQKAFLDQTHRWHGLWPSEVRQRINQLSNPVQQRAVLVLVTNAAFSELSRHGSCGPRQALGLMYEGTRLRNRRTETVQEGMAGATGKRGTLRQSVAGDHGWLEFLAEQASGDAGAIPPDSSDLDVYEDSWAKEGLAVCGPDAAFSKSSRYTVGGDFPPEVVEGLAGFTTLLKQALETSVDFRNEFQRAVGAHQGQAMAGARESVALLEQIQQAGAPVDRVLGVFSETPSVLNSTFRFEGRQALRELEASPDGRAQLEKLVREHLLEMGRTEAFVSDHTGQVIERVYSTVRESAVRLQVMGDEREFDAMRSSLPANHRELVQWLASQTDFHRLQLGLFHLKDRLQEEVRPWRADAGGQELLRWWQAASLDWRLDAQIFDIVSDDRVLDLKNYDVWSAILKKVAPSITQENPAALYLQKGLLNLLILNRGKPEPQRAAEAERFKTEVLPNLMPFLQEQRHRSPAFYQQILAPVMAVALNIPANRPNA